MIITTTNCVLCTVSLVHSNAEVPANFAIIEGDIVNIQRLMPPMQCDMHGWSILRTAVRNNDNYKCISEVRLVVLHTVSRKIENHQIYVILARIEII